MVRNSLYLKDHKQPCKLIVDDIKKEPLTTEWCSQLVGAKIPLSHATCMENDLWRVT